MSVANRALKTVVSRGFGTRSRRENLEGWLWASPWIAGFVIFTVGPMIASVYLSLTDYPLLQGPTFNGIDNYKQLFTDELILQSLKVTTIYSFVSIPLHLVVGFLIALLLNQNVRGLSLWRVIYYLPAVVSGVAVAYLWQWILNSDFGLANWVLSMVGIDGPNWLIDPNWALSALILMSLWGVGGGMLIYLAGLQGIPTSLYEAAEIDGANFWQKFWIITIPMMSPVLFFLLVIGIIGALQTFTQAYIITNGGPDDATLFFMLHLYRNAFQYLKMGYAAAMAWVLFAYIMLLTLLVFRSSSLWVYYEGDFRGRG